jgi:hypothetical protein
MVLFCALFRGAPPAAAANTATFTPDADAWVSDDAPDANHGSDAALQVDGSPISRAYLRFNGTIPNDAMVTHTTLRLYSPSASSTGVDIRMTSTNSWDEGTITFNNAPSSPIFASNANTIAAGWNSFSLPLFDPGSPATYVVTRASAEALSVQSRESLNRPELIVEYTMPSTAPTTVCSPAGCFESRPWIYTMSWATTVADFNGDGRDDHLVGRHTEQSGIQLQQPDGSFAPGFLFPLMDRHGCAAGDINRDGRIDLFCAIGAGGGEDTKQDEVWIAKPDGTYVNEVSTWGPVDPFGRGRRPLLFDFDNDGLLDLYTTSVGFRPDGARSENILWLNRGDPSTGGGGFVEKRVTATGPWGEQCVADGDWNNDGFRDFLVCGPQNSVALHLFQNQGGTATEQSDWMLGTPLNSPQDATLSDLNGDGWEDLVVVTAQELQVRFNLGCATCARYSRVDLRVPLVDGRSVAVGDLTGDGLKDIYVVQGFADGKNAEDMLLAGPDWAPMKLPQADAGTGDTAEFIKILGRQTVIVTNGYSPGPYYSRGPVQFISFYRNVPYARPKAATPYRASLVPAYKPCVTNQAADTHGAPLSFRSCKPPKQASGYTTVGTPDANGKPANSVGWLMLKVKLGNSATVEDEADVRISGSITDVRNASDLFDYAGSLAANISIRITDRNNGDAQSGLTGTTVDLHYSFPIACSPTSVSSVGATCAVNTTADAIAPGTVREGERAIWGMGQVRVFDGGPDGDPSTVPNSPIASQGLFVP